MAGGWRITSGLLLVPVAVVGLAGCGAGTGSGNASGMGSANASSGGALWRKKRPSSIGAPSLAAFTFTVANAATFGWLDPSALPLTPVAAIPYAAFEALHQWHFEPNAASKYEVTVNFEPPAK